MSRERRNRNQSVYRHRKQNPKAAKKRLESSFPRNRKIRNAMCIWRKGGRRCAGRRGQGPSAGELMANFIHQKTLGTGDMGDLNASRTISFLQKGDPRVLGWRDLGRGVLHHGQRLRLPTKGRHDSSHWLRGHRKGGMRGEGKPQSLTSFPDPTCA